MLAPEANKELTRMEDEVEAAQRVAGTQVTIRPLPTEDVVEADRIMRLAFGTFLGLADPLAFMSDGECVRTRWAADPQAVLGAYLDGALVGSNVVTRWGSVGFFGPLSVRPELWDRGIAQQLLVPTMEFFARWGTTVAGLFTFSHSPRHIGLYQKFGFWPRFLTAVTAKAVNPGPAVRSAVRYSELSPSECEQALRDCRGLTDSLYEGLDVTGEIRAVKAQRLGDTLLLRDESRLEGFAVCHTGPGSEAGGGVCYVKFAAARPGHAVAKRFGVLVDACQTLAAASGASRLVAGVNTARHEAYRLLLANGFRTDFTGICMQRDNSVGYNHPGVYLIDDWR